MTAPTIDVLARAGEDQVAGEDVIVRGDNVRRMRLALHPVTRAPLAALTLVDGRIVYLDRKAIDQALSALPSGGDRA